VLVSALASGFSAAPSFAQSMQASDAFIEGKLSSIYTLNEQLNPFDIKVESRDGVVTLSGNVESDVERELAVELAKNVEGVKSVEDRLAVAPEAQRDESRSGFARGVEDATITAKIKSQLLWNSQTDGLDINVNTRDAHVTLEGTVGSEAEATLAEQIARNTEGVEAVTNQLVIKAQEEPTIVDRTEAAVKTTAEAVKETAKEVGENVQDVWITTKVKTLLTWDKRFDDTDVEVETENGVVNLAGTVASAENEQQLIDAVQNVKGVKNVNAQLQVK
jgi:osmotically-inducible protein OsmY